MVHVAGIKLHSNLMDGFAKKAFRCSDRNKRSTAVLCIAGNNHLQLTSFGINSRHQNIANAIYRHRYKN